jgi:hypothetical protein
MTMIGPVLYHEIVLGARRTRLYVFRWVYAGWLLLTFFWITFLTWGSRLFSSRLHFFTESVSAQFTASLVVQQFALCLLATPAIVAGSITDEKRNNTLLDLLATDLLSWQIIVGKLVARLAQVWLLILVTLPLVAFLGVLGGMQPFGVMAVYATLLLPTLGVGAVSMLASVWTRQTRDAVLAVYFIKLVSYAVIRLLAWLGYPFLAHKLDPFYVLQPAWGVMDADAWKDFGMRWLESAFTWGSLALCCLVVASLRLRGAFLRQLENSGKKKRKRWWRFSRPEIGVMPLPWKERHVDGLAPFPVLRAIPRWLGIILIFLATSAVGSLILIARMGGTFRQNYDQAVSLLRGGQFEKLFYTIQPADHGFYWLGAGGMLFFSFLVGVRCSGTICGEREKKSWEALLLTPLTERELIHGKLWGIINTCWPYYIAFVVPALWFSILSDLPSCLQGKPHFGSILFSLIWAGVTCLAMFFVGSAGIWCSTRARGSWRSLLATLLWSYGSGAIALVVTSPVMFILAGILFIAIMIVDGLIFKTQFFAGTGAGVGQAFTLCVLILSCVMLAILSLLLSLTFLYYSRKYVAYRERTREWDAGKRYPRRIPRRSPRWPDEPMYSRR